MIPMFLCSRNIYISSSHLTGLRSFSPVHPVKYSLKNKHKL